MSSLMGEVCESEMSTAGPPQTPQDHLTVHGALLGLPPAAAKMDSVCLWASCLVTNINARVSSRNLQNGCSSCLWSRSLYEHVREGTGAHTLPLLQSYLSSLELFSVEIAGDQDNFQSDHLTHLSGHCRVFEMWAFQGYFGMSLVCTLALFEIYPWVIYPAVFSVLKVNKLRRAGISTDLHNIYSVCPSHSAKVNVSLRLNSEFWTVALVVI